MHIYRHVDHVVLDVDDMAFTAFPGNITLPQYVYRQESASVQNTVELAHRIGFRLLSQYLRYPFIAANTGRPKFQQIN